MFLAYILYIWAHMGVMAVAQEVEQESTYWEVSVCLNVIGHFGAPKESG